MLTITNLATGIAIPSPEMSLSSYSPSHYHQGHTKTGVNPTETFQQNFDLEFSNTASELAVVIVALVVFGRKIKKQNRAP